MPAAARKLGEGHFAGKEKFGFFCTIVDAMLKTGFDADEITKIGGGNFCRVFDASTSGK